MTTEEPVNANPSPDVMTPTLPYGVGIDTHKAFIQVCILYQYKAATHREEQEFTTTWFDLNRARNWIISTLKRFHCFTDNENLRYTIESTGCYHIPVCQALQGTPAIINPVLAGPTRRKTDVLDARTLAHHSIVGLWKESYQLQERDEVLRCLIAMRNESSRNSSRVINRVNNHLLRFGHTLGRDGSVADMLRRPLVEDMCRGMKPFHEALKPDGLPEDVRCIFMDSFSQHDFFKDLKAVYHKRSLAWTAKNQWPTQKGMIDGKALLRHLQSVPGVGEVTALTWLSVVSDPRRFQHPKQVAAFCGSDPSVKVSAGKTTSHTKRKGNARLHHALKNVASSLVRRHSEPFGQWAFAIVRRHRKAGWGRAINALARRLAISLWHVHRLGQDFDYSQYHFFKTPLVPDMPVENMDIGDRYIAALKDMGLKTTCDVARAYLTSIPQQKGIGVQCLLAIKQWIEANKLPDQPQVPIPELCETQPAETGGKDSTRQVLSAFLDKSPDAHVRTSLDLPTPPPAKSPPAKRSRTASRAKKST